jgi:ferredoxin-NADP reductase
VTAKSRQDLRQDEHQTFPFRDRGDVCGPVGLINAFEVALTQAGVDRESIHYEEFSFR